VVVVSGPLEGKVGIVTGGGRGIGAAVAAMAASYGASIVVSDLGGGAGGGGTGDKSVAQETADGIVAAGGRSIADPGDVTSFEDMSRTVEVAVETFGRLDFLVHSAGILRDGIFHKMPPEDFVSVLQVHLVGAFNAARAAAPVFRSQGSGSVVFMTSTSGLIGAVGQANYSAAKAGMVGLSRSIAVDMARFGVRSNAIGPFAATRLTASLGDVEGEASDRVRRLMAIGPETVASVAGFLVSDEAADISGQIFVVRNNEVFLMSQSRPLRSVHNSDGWDFESLRTVMLPSIRSYLYPLETSAEHFSWDPI
jgi:NAD(P)-dependent dehydrogenase (short-subunit alcohol dehydrogenase family)